MLENVRRRMSALSRLRSARAVGLLGACLAAIASAEPLAPERVPEPLRPWVDWVLSGHEAERCPFLNGGADSRECVWPARLELALGARQGSFVQRWRVYADAWVPLPGDAKHWPQAVQVDGRPAAVIESAGRPSVRLLPGAHEVRGELFWDAPPELLQIPAETGLLALSQGGERIAFPKRDAQGRLWLHSAAPAEAGDESRLEIAVFRRIVDEIPLRVETRIRLEVSGPAREVVLGRALPEGAVPMSLSAPIPARIDPDGKLRVQVRPGTWFVEIEARLPGPVESLALPAPDGPWDDREEWVFDARPSLRQVSVEGAASIDPQQTELPDEWRALPAFALEPGSALRFVTKRRGDADPAPDRLELVRNWWLDFDGKGYTVSDRIRGAMVRSDRLSMAPGTELGRVAVNGRDQFITRLPGEASTGVEVPRGEIEISADSRIPEAGSRVPAVGWDADFQSVSAQLQLPPGWRLLYASGVDSVSHSWLTPLVAARSLRRARGGDGVPAPLRRRLGGARARGTRAHLHRARSAALGVDRGALGRGAAPCGRSRAARRAGAHAVAGRARPARAARPPLRAGAAARRPASRAREPGARGSGGAIFDAAVPAAEEGRGRTGAGPGGKPRVQSAGVEAAARARLPREGTRRPLASEGRSELRLELGARSQGAHHHRPGAADLELAHGLAALARTRRARSDAAAAARAAVAERGARRPARAAARGAAAARAAARRARAWRSRCSARRGRAAALAALLLAAPAAACGRGVSERRAARALARAPARSAGVPSELRREPAAAPRGRARRGSCCASRSTRRRRRRFRFPAARATGCPSR